MSAGTAGRLHVDTGAVDQATRFVARRLLGRLAGGRLTVVEGGSRTSFGKPGDLDATLRVHDPSFWPRVVTRAGLGLAETYRDGLWETDDLVAVLRLLARNLDRLNRVARNPMTRVRRILGSAGRSRPPSADTDRRNVQAHYDAGDDFFALFLDPTMAYSCAFFERPDMTLEEASIAKFERICRLLALTPDSHVIEIGGGWGGFAVHAATHHGCRVTTTTLSERQYDYTRRRVRGEGLDDRIVVQREHFRDLRGEYTHLVSVEMIEAVDWRQYDEFFATAQRLLLPDGLAAIQAIVLDDREFERSLHWNNFIKEYVFPGGCLPSVGAMLDATARATDLRLVELLDIGSHYVTTLCRWREALDSRLGEARALGWDDHRLRMWTYYFAYCEAGFAERRLSDVQMLLARPGWSARASGGATPPAPLTHGHPRSPPSPGDPATARLTAT